MTLFRTSLLSALAVFTRLSVSIYLNKILAVLVGPAGFALIGQFQSLVSVVTALGGGAVQVGVTKYTAEYSADPARQQRLWSTALVLSLLGSVVTSIALVLLRVPLSKAIFGSPEFADVIVYLGLTLAFVGLNGLFLAILNGAKAVRHLVTANVVGSLLGAAISTALVLRFGIWGALVALAVGPACACGVTWLVLRRVCRIEWTGRKAAFDPAMMKRLGGFALMAATTALVVPVGQVLTRNSIAADFGWATAGLWQALWKVSETHLLLLTSVLSVYFLPRLSEIRTGPELRKEVMSAYRFVIPLVVCSALFLFLLRAPLVRMLLSPQFAAIAPVLGLQLIGDVFKVCSWVMSFTMVSHARTRTFVVTEIVFTVLTAGGIIIMTHFYGLKGAAIAYIGVYLLYWVTMYALFERLVSELGEHEPVPTEGAGPGLAANGLAQ